MNNHNKTTRPDNPAEGFDALQQAWQQAKAEAPPAGGPANAAALLASAKQKVRRSVAFHYGNMAVLGVVLVGICLCFYFFFPFKTTASHWGEGLMVGGLLVRILVEAASSARARRIRLTDTAVGHHHSAGQFYRFRKRIHGPVTIGIVGLYTLGFALLLPEFSRYLSMGFMVYIVASYIVGAIFLVWQIKKGIRREMNDLAAITELQNSLLA